MAKSRGRPVKAASSGATASKRKASPVTTPRRQSKRVKSETPKDAKTTPEKSIYFEPDTEPETENSVEGGEDGSGYEDEDASVTELEPTEEEDASEEDEKPRKRKSLGSTKSIPAKKIKVNGGELWREGVKSHLEPGKEVFIELPKARPAGTTAYSDDRIHPNTMLFLTDLKQNNDRIWLKTHDADFRQSEKDWKSFVEALSEKLIDVDDTIPELPVKDVVYRIYRDVRFSKDQTPYKSYFSAAWSRTGRKGPYAVYYAHIQPKGQSLIGGGLWMPDAGQLSKLRRHIDRKPHKLKAVLMQEGIRKSFLNGVAKDEKKVVKAFAAANKSNALKKKPKDYEADHPEIELLKLRNFTISSKLSDSQITDRNILDQMTALMIDMEPFVTYLNSVVMPDDESSDDDNDDDDDDQNGAGIESADDQEDETSAANMDADAE